MAKRKRQRRSKRFGLVSPAEKANIDMLVEHSEYLSERAERAAVDNSCASAFDTVFESTASLARALAISPYSKHPAAFQKLAKAKIAFWDKCVRGKASVRKRMPVWSDEFYPNGD